MAGEARLVDEGMTHGPSPYEPLSDYIIRYYSQGEVFLVGDFNARTQSQQCTIFQMDRHPEMVNIDPFGIGTTHRSKDQGADTMLSGHHLLELGSRHRMVIYNGLNKWPGLKELACFPHGGGESTIDYLIGSLEATYMINSFLVALLVQTIGSYTLS